MTPSTPSVPPQDAVVPLAAALDERGVRLVRGSQSIQLHPQWLRERSQETGEIDPTNRQRLYTPLELGAGSLVTECSVDGDSLVLSWGDGHSARLSLAAIEHRIGWAIDAEEPPEPEPWSAPLSTFPHVEWADIGWSIAEENTDSVLAYLEAFYRHGYVVFRNTPTELNTIVRICDRLGYISGSNFGTVFDVRAEKIPTDLAFTTRALTAHSDLPYRQSIPGIQLLHCLRNEAPGGDST